MLKSGLVLVAFLAVASGLNWAAIHEASKQVHDAGQSCSDCEKIAKYVSTVANDKAKLYTFKSTMKTMCNMFIQEIELGNCLNIADNFEIALKGMESYLQNPTVLCSRLSFCGSTSRQVPHLLATVMQYLAAKTEGEKKVEEVVCSECQFVTTGLQQVLKEKETKAEAEQLLKKLCSYMSGAASMKCQHAVKENFSTMYDEFAALLTDAKTFCGDLALCPANLNAPPSMTRLVPALLKQAKKHYITTKDYTLNTPQLSASMEFVKSIRTNEGKSANCFLCNVLVTGLVGVLQDSDADQKQLCGTVQNFVCNSVMPQAYMVDCNNFLGMYLQAVLQMTLTQMTVMQPPLCQKVNMCAATDIANLPDLKDSQMKCESCQLITEFVRKQFGSFAAKKEIQVLVENACEDLAPEMSANCKSVANRRVIKIMDNIADYFNKQSCMDFNLCQAV